ncbi:type II toxin-antitoxin system YafQ family toxin [Eisenbergiella sp.]
MRDVFYSGKFRKDFKLAIKRGFNMSLIKNVMKDLENGTPLDPKYKEHPLGGDYIGTMECHIQPDWLLVYALEETSVTFIRTGTHSDLF